MKCEESQQTFSQYLDGELTANARAALDEHLAQCPVCRAQLSESRALQRGLALLARPVAPANLADTINHALLIEAAARRKKVSRSVPERIRLWLESRLLPYTVGSFASLILFIGMFGALRLSLVTMRDWDVAARHADAKSYELLYAQDSRDRLPDLYKPVSAQDYAAGRDPFAIESPSLNPKGALAAFTRSNMHARAEADDMVVIADVFSDGSASLADVMQPPKDRHMLDDFQSALRQDAAFVPASFDRRPETMRVVFVVQRVDVREQKF